MDAAVFIPVLFAYFVVAWILLRRCRGAWRLTAFGILNLLGYYFAFVVGHPPRYLNAFCVYLMLMSFQYLMARLFSKKNNGLMWIAFFTPIFFLILLRCLSPGLLAGFIPSLAGRLNHGSGLNLASLFMGLSYMAFRSSYLVLEVANGAAKLPGLWEYLGFCFFLPTVPVGPINSFKNYQSAFAGQPLAVPFGRCALRILVGFAKYKFLGAFFNQLTYDGLLSDDHPHHWVDLPVAMVFYYLFLYCNFSGFCDMAIGAAGLIGIPVTENFDNPLLARNMRELWKRWHITLSLWMRDVVFTPLSKFLVRIMGVSRANHAVALTIVAVFLLIGIWHGVGWNYAMFGMAQALGVVTVHYYTIILKKRLGRERLKAYDENRLIQAAAVTITFCYFAATLFLFANPLPQMQQILASLR